MKSALKYAVASWNPINPQPTAPAHFTGMKKDIHTYKDILENVFDGVYLLDRHRTITYWNEGAERLTGFSASEVLGKQCSQNLLLHLDENGENLCARNCPVEKTLNDGQTREIQIYLHHKDGHRVPVSLRVSPVRDSDRNIIGAAEIFSDNFSGVILRRRIEDLKKQSLLDHLTQLANRRALEMKLHSRTQEMREFGISFGVLFIDIDRFKKVNDSYGHNIGDGVLRMVAKSLSNGLRPFDFIGRWGGEEFIAVLVNIDSQALEIIAERCRLLVEKSKLTEARTVIRVTVSIGATMAQPDDDLHALVRRADQLMYRCKQMGRNCVNTEL